jgi:hypothetical protein
MNFLDKEYGIKEGQSYKITYENDTRGIYNINKGLIINFTPQQIIVKSDKGLHIFKPKYITEMKPLDKLATFEDFCESLEKTQMLDSTKVQDTLQKVGIALYNNNGTIKSMYDVMTELSKVFKNMDKDEEYKHTKANIKDNVCSVLVGIQNKNKLISALDKLEN